MKKTIISLSLLLLILPILAITLQDAEREFPVNLMDLTKNLQEVTTEKETDGEIIIRHWLGVNLQYLLQKYDIKDFGNIRFTSADNYLVRLSKDDIINHDPVIALYEDGKLLKNNNRLVSASLPAMFWIQDINIISTEAAAQLSQPKVMYFAENLLANLELVTAPEPFVKAEGYFLRDVLQQIMPIPAGEYQLIARDGTSHYLDFEGFLKKAVLVKTEDGYNLQSPQMPGGMWIKKLAYIQKGEMAIIFRDQFTSWQEVQNLNNWHEAPQKLNVYTAEGKLTLSYLPGFNNEIWKSILKMVW